HVADQIIKEVTVRECLEREDVRVYISRWVANILYLSLFQSKEEYHKMRCKYCSFFLAGSLPFRTRLYAAIATCGISVFRFHAIARYLYTCLCSVQVYKRAMFSGFGKA
ncbi:MAG: hypothetical protein PVH19_07620, partial [Planctomycetia bacterium]